jgi:hypothetical protein
MLHRKAMYRVVSIGDSNAQFLISFFVLFLNSMAARCSTQNSVLQNTGVSRIGQNIWSLGGGFSQEEKLP